jgi:hypothetical protein
MLEYNLQREFVARERTSERTRLMFTAVRLDLNRPLARHSPLQKRQSMPFESSVGHFHN